MSYPSLKLSCKWIISQGIRSLSKKCELARSIIILRVTLVIVVASLQGDQDYSLTLMFVVNFMSCE